MNSRDRSRQAITKPQKTQRFVLSRKVMVLANILKRAAGARYRRLLGLPPGEWGVIAQLGERAPRSLNDLADAMGLDKTQISRSVSSLVERGLVTRANNPTNHREVLIGLSLKGAAAEAVIRKAGSVANEVLLEGLTSVDRIALEEQLNIFTSRAERLLAAEQDRDLTAQSDDN
jgi:DNA-binding MarR family transcriptional regulator